MGDHLYQCDYHFDFDDNINVILHGNACSGPTSLMRHRDHQYQPPVPFQPVAPRSPASSTTTSSSPMVDTFCAPPAQENSQLFNQSKGLFSGDPVNVSSSDEFVSDNVRVRGGNVSCSVLGVTENVTPNDHEYESEEAVETLADEGQPKAKRPAPRSSKRSRAAEVHNLSEKRRRSRINEKMKALQNLIPNSNKTDKASMLDEAIEYLKQLQLQVQMLTLRNGFTFNSMGVPEPLSPVQLAEMRMAFYLETGATDINSTGAHALNQETPSEKVLSLPNQYCMPNQLETPKMSNTVNSETSLVLDSSVEAHFRLFQPCTAYREIFKEDMLQNLQLNPSETNPSDTVMCPFNPQAFALKESSAFETCLIGRDQEDVRLKSNLLLSPHSTGMQTGSRVPGDNFNLERSFEVYQTLVLN